MKYTFLIVVMLSLTSCSLLERQQQLSCSPVNAVGCTGFLTDKPIILEEDI